MKKLILIGAGNVGGYLSFNIGLFGDYDVLGFLDDDPEKLGKEVHGRRVIGKIDAIHNWQAQEVSVAICIAAPVIRAAIARPLLGIGFDFPNFIPRQAWLSEAVSLGRGNILYPGVSINYESTLGDFVVLNMNCAIGHNCQLKSFVTLAPGVNLAGFTQVGECADIGIGVSTRQRVVIGKNAVVGGQSMIIHNVPDNSRVAGVPAKVIS